MGPLSRSGGPSFYLPTENIMALLCLPVQCSPSRRSVIRRGDTCLPGWAFLSTYRLSNLSCKKNPVFMRWVLYSGFRLLGGLHAQDEYVPQCVDSLGYVGFMRICCF